MQLKTAEFYYEENENNESVWPGVCVCMCVCVCVCVCVYMFKHSLCRLGNMAVVLFSMQMEFHKMVLPLMYYAGFLGL